MIERKLVIAICDDEPIFVEQIKRQCEIYCEEKSIEYKIIEMHSGEEILNYSGECISLLFLDIEMGGIDGLSVLKHIEKDNLIWKVIFVSSHEECVWNSFGIKTLGFERKPIDADRVGKYIDIAINEIQADRIIRFECNKYVWVSQILYIQAQRSYVQIVTSEETIVADGNIGKWEEKIKGTSLIRVHKSFIINMDHVFRFNKDCVVLVNSKQDIPIGRKYSGIRDIYNNYIIKKMTNRF